MWVLRNCSLFDYLILVINKNKSYKNDGLNVLKGKTSSFILTIPQNEIDQFCHFESFKN